MLQHRTYTYRADGALTGVDDQLRGPRTFDLDAAGRVTAVQAADWTESYAYDPAGNLTDAHWPASDGFGVAGAAIVACTHTGTQLATAGRVRYEYDACFSRRTGTSCCTGTPDSKGLRVGSAARYGRSSQATGTRAASDLTGAPVAARRLSGYGGSAAPCPKPVRALGRADRRGPYRVR